MACIGWVASSREGRGGRRSEAEARRRGEGVEGSGVGDGHGIRSRLANGDGDSDRSSDRGVVAFFRVEGGE